MESDPVPHVVVLKTRTDPGATAGDDRDLVESVFEITGRQVNIPMCIGNRTVIDRKRADGLSVE